MNDLEEKECCKKKESFVESYDHGDGDTPPHLTESDKRRNLMLFVFGMLMIGTAIARYFIDILGSAQ